MPPKTPIAEGDPPKAGEPTGLVPGAGGRGGRSPLPLSILIAPGQDPIHGFRLHEKGGITPSLLWKNSGKHGKF